MLSGKKKNKGCVYACINKVLNNHVLSVQLHRAIASTLPDTFLHLVL